MAQRRLISILSLSRNRAVIKMADDFKRPHGYGIGGISESDPLSPKDLALALCVLEPQPHAVLVGKAYPEEETTETRNVIAEYLKELGVDDGTVIKITPKVFNEVGKEGVPKWVLEQLNVHFEK